MTPYSIFKVTAAIMALFRISPIVEEMQLLNGFAEERKRQVFRLNEELVALCANGQLSALQRRLQTTSRSELLNYFIADMFLKALESGHFAVCSYMVQQGYPLHSNDPSVKIPHAPFLAMNLVSDQRGRDMLEYLGRLEYDVNTPHDRDWLTLLHVAVRRQLVSTVEYLLARTNADVNAVAEDDVMPLTLALAAESSPMKDQITELLLAKYCALLCMFIQIVITWL